MLELDRKQAGWSVGQAASRLGVSVREYREIEAGAHSPSFETWDRICMLYGWPQTFIGERRRDA
jgi:transcriptional regulator with XRE-family HTH domain